MKLKIQKKGAQKTDRLELWSSAGNAGGHCSTWHTRVYAGMQGCRMYYGNTVQLLHMWDSAFLSFSFFLRKATPAQPTPVSRRIPFSGDSGGGKRVKCITLAHELLHARPGNSTVFPVWPKVGERKKPKKKRHRWRGFPSGRRNGARVQREKVWGLVRGEGRLEERRRAAGGSTDRLFGLRQESPGAAQESEEEN